MKRIIFKFLYTLGFILAVKSLIAQDIQVTASLDSNRILIGDQLKYTVQVLAPKNAKVEFPVLADSLTSLIEIVDQKKEYVLEEASMNRFFKEFTITCFDSGVHAIPPFPVIVHQTELNRVDTLVSNPEVLVVNTFLIDSTSNAIFDIKPPVSAPITFKEVAPYVVGVWLVAILVLLLIYFFRKKKKNQPILSRPKPVEPAHIIALRKLDDFSVKKLWQQGLVKEFHSELTEIVREYLHNRFNVDALEQTTPEILNQVETGKFLDINNFSILSEMLGLADLVKFAKFQPLPDENEKSLKAAYEFVLSTKQKVDLRADEKEEEKTQTVES